MHVIISGLVPSKLEGESLRQVNTSVIYRTPTKAPIDAGNHPSILTYETFRRPMGKRDVTGKKGCHAPRSHLTTCHPCKGAIHGREERALVPVCAKPADCRIEARAIREPDSTVRI